MLSKRGYNIVREELDMTFDAFCRRFAPNGEVLRDELTIIAADSIDENIKIIVFFGKSGKLTTDDQQKCSTRLTQDGIRNAIIIVENTTPRFDDGVYLLNSRGNQHFEVFNISELLVNIIDHVLVPEHIPLKPDEIKEFFNSYKLKPTQLPRILVNDPISRYYGMKKGDIFKIVRKSETAGKYVTYRIVV